MSAVEVRATLSRARARWAGMAGRLGLGFCALGFVVLAVAWNGAANLDYSQGQIPYLISGGIGGLGLIVIGAALIIAESNRRDRALLERKLEDIEAALGRMGGSAGATNGARPRGQVVAGRSSYHRASCRLVSGRDDLERLPRAQAEEAGLVPCRVCSP